MRTHELPEEWQREVDPAYTQLTAHRLGILPENVMSIVCLEAPDTALGREYYQWYINITTSSTDNNIVPVILMNMQNFLQSGGRQRLDQFNEAMINTGRPCHLARVDGIKTIK